MSDRILYSLDEAAQKVSQSVKTLRRAIASTDPKSFPPPLAAKRQGDRPNAPYQILHDELVAWARSLKDA